MHITSYTFMAYAQIIQNIIYICPFVLSLNVKFPIFQNFLSPETASQLFVKTSYIYILFTIFSKFSVPVLYSGLFSHALMYALYLNYSSTSKLYGNKKKFFAEIEENIKGWEPRIKMLIEKIYWPYLKLCDNYLPSLPTDSLEFFSIGELFFSFSPEIDN